MDAAYSRLKRSDDMFSGEAFAYFRNTMPIFPAL